MPSPTQRPYRCLDQPLEPAVEPAPGRTPEALEDAVRATIAAQPLSPASWGQLGALRWEQAVRDGSRAARDEAELAFDLARMLSWPWTGDVPHAASERMHRARCGETEPAGWPARTNADNIRGAVLAFLAGAVVDSGWVAACYETLARPLPGLRLESRFWMAMAVCERLGDAEQRARFAEQMQRLLGEAVRCGSPVELAAIRRRTVAPVFSGLRQAILAEPASSGLPALLDPPVVAQAVSRLRGPDLPLAGALAALPGLGECLTPRRLATVLELGAEGGTSWSAALQAQSEGWPPAARALVALAIRRDDAAFPLQLLSERISSGPLRVQADWLIAACRAVRRHDPPARTEALQRILTATEAWPEAGRKLRLPVTLAVVEACHELPLSAQLGPTQTGLLERARRGWTSATDHDRVGLAVVRALLANGGAEGALDQARFYATRIDQAAERAEALLRVAAAVATTSPDDAARMAGAALRRVRSQVADPARQPALQLEAARLLMAGDDPEGVAVLLGWARRPRAFGRPGRCGAHELVRALAEPGPGQPTAWAAAESLAARLRGRRGWLARLHLAACGPASARAERLRDAAAHRPRRLTTGESLLAALVQDGEPDAATWPALLAALPSPGALRPGVATEGAAMVAAVGKLDTTVALDPFVDWAAARSHAGERFVGRLLFGEGLQTLIERRAEESATAVGESLAASFAAQLARAAEARR